ncbi:hypothetical protein PINS_up008801 [Pythium insidiosum]|nr:hypothetical protein PINS_up008801 [Pythium insidiosum]
MQSLLLMVMLGEDDAAVALSAKETAMQWLSIIEVYGEPVDFARVQQSLFPIAFFSQNHSKVEIALLAKNVTNAFSLSLRLIYPPEDTNSLQQLESLLEMLKQFATHKIWKTRAAVLRFLASFTFYHWIFLDDVLKQRIRDLVVSFLTDEQREVQDMAKYTLRNLTHIERTATVSKLSEDFRAQAQDARTKHPKFMRRLQRQEKDQEDDVEIAKTKERIKTNEKKMASSVLGMSAVILAFPYSVPSFVPPLFEELGRYLYLKHSTPTVSYLEKAVKDTLLEFKRTHQDNWLEIKANFTAEQRDVFEDVLISPSYYT